MQSIADREAYEVYRKTRRKVAKEIDQYKLFVKAIGGLSELLLKFIRESESGVYLEGIGYFFHNKNQNKRKGRGKEPFLKRIKKRYTYFLDFYPDKNLEDYFLTYENTVQYDKKEYTVYFEFAESVTEAEKNNRKIHQSLKNTRYIL